MIIGCFAWFEKDGMILLQKRAGQDTFAGKWGFIGGGQEPNESTFETLVREVREESSINIHVADLIHLHESKNHNDKDILLLIWKVKDWSGQAEVLEPEETESYEWLSKDNPPENALPSTKTMIDAINKQSLYSKS